MIEGVATKILYGSLYGMSSKKMYKQFSIGAPNHNKLRINRYRKSLRKAKIILESFSKYYPKVSGVRAL